MAHLFSRGMHKKLHKMCIVIEVVTIIELIKLAPHLTVDTWNYISLVTHNISRGWTSFSSVKSNASQHKS